MTRDGPVGRCFLVGRSQTTRRVFARNKTPPSGRGGAWTCSPIRGVRGTRSGPLMLPTALSSMRCPHKQRASAGLFVTCGQPTTKV